jgi:hypothetical protein
MTCEDFGLDLTGPATGPYHHFHTHFVHYSHLLRFLTAILCADVSHFYMCDVRFLQGCQVSDFELDATVTHYCTSFWTTNCHEVCPAGSYKLPVNCTFYCSLCFVLVHVVAQLVRHCATNRKVADSIPDCVIGIFHSSGRTMALGLNQPLTEMSTRNIS